ncbi:unnamed protein product [Discula destructiva]
MGTASPILAIPHGVDPSSVPHTPPAPSPPPLFSRKISSGSGSGPGGFSPPVPPASLSQPPSTHPFTPRHISCMHPLVDLAIPPHTSQSSDADVSEPEPDLCDDDSRSDSPPLWSRQSGMDEGYVSRTRVTMRAGFVIEELSDFDENDMEGRTDIIHPTTIEYAESERPTDAQIDRRILNDLENLKCRSPDPRLSSDDSDLDEDAHHAILQEIRERERRHRMSKSSGTKRTMSERGSDNSDQEDTYGCIGFEEAGSSAQRLRKRIAGDRRSLIFQDPPPRIDEVIEPEELEETLARELPFYEYTSMEVDSPRSSYG